MAASGSPLASSRVVVLPDLFIDAVVRLPPWDTARVAWGQVVARGGGNVAIEPVQFKLGGNAANLGVALARLGARVELIARTDGLGRSLLAAAEAGPTLGTSLLRPSPAASATLALELGGSNLMLSHAGPLADFGPEALAPTDWRAIRGADAVAVVNWAQNRKGTALLGAVAKRMRGGRLFVDTSDPRMAAPRMAGLLAATDVWKRTASWAMNDNELRAFTGDGRGSLATAAMRLSQSIGCSVDLHTRHWAAHVDGRQSVRIAASGGRPRRLTGAGDAWNAGNIAGHLLGLPPAARLRLAHTVAGKYVTGRDGRTPTFDEIPGRLWG